MRLFLFICLAGSLGVHAQNPSKNSEKNDKEKKIETITPGETHISQKEYQQILQEVKKDLNNYTKVLIFIQQEFIDKSEKKITSLNRQISTLIKRKNKAKTKKTKAKHEAEITTLKNLIKVEELWPYYYKAFKVYKQALLDKDNKRYTAGIKLATDIEKKYVEITGDPFPSMSAGLKKKLINEAKKRREAKKRADAAKKKRR